MSLNGGLLTKTYIKRTDQPVHPHSLIKASIARLQDKWKLQNEWTIEKALFQTERVYNNYGPSFLHTVDSRYLELQGTLKNSSRYPVLRHIRFADLRKK